MYNFDQIIDRRNTNCVKYDNLANVFGCTDILPMWVADMDFQVAPEILLTSSLKKYGLYKRLITNYLYFCVP